MSTVSRYGGATPGTPARLLCGAALLLPLPAIAAEAAAPQLEFNPVFLQGGSQVDLSRFARGNAVLPGDYVVDLHINGRWVSRVAVRFIGEAGSDVARPCVDRAMFDRIGLDPARLAEPVRTALAAVGQGGCVDVAGLIEDASVSFELSSLRLDISVPQASLLRAPRDYVGPEYWDEGVPSATLGYNLNGYRSTAAGHATTRGHADLLSGANYGSWHLRHRSYMDVVSGGSTTYQGVATYLEHDIPALRSNLTIGDSFSDGAVFASVGFRGISLASSDQMLPDSQREFAPVVRGVARTNARVVITQNGVAILETTVSPGAFEIDDLYAAGYGGDLDVVVHEADGSQQNFIVPYSPMVQLLRPGVWRYQLTAGALRPDAAPGNELFAMGTLQRGISSRLTGYAGAIGAEHHAAALLGMALNTGMGAWSVDVTHARTDAGGEAVSGQGVRFSYNKLLRWTDTSITMSATPYLSTGYYSLAEAQALRLRATLPGAEPPTRLRRQWQAGINQDLPGRWGNFFLSATVRDFRQSARTATQLQAGYSNRFRLWRLRLNYGIAVARQDNALTGDRDQRIQANFSLPLGAAAHSPMLSTSYIEDTTADVRTRGGQAVLIGSGGEQRQLSYSLTASKAADATAFAANGQHRGAYASTSASIGKGSGFSQQSLGATGGLVIHRGGVTLSNQLTDTFGIIEAPGAEGARVTNNIGTVVNRAGFAVLPFLLPYRMNSVNIDPEGAVSPDVEFRSTTAMVAPRRNSVVLVRFETVTGRPILIAVRRPDGSEVPFGAVVSDARGNEVGLTGQDGRIYLRGVPDNGILTVSWGDEPGQNCSFAYRLPAKQAGNDPFVRLESTCVPATLAGLP